MFARIEDINPSVKPKNPSVKSILWFTGIEDRNPSIKTQVMVYCERRHKSLHQNPNNGLLEYESEILQSNPSNFY